MKKFFCAAALALWAFALAPHAALADVMIGAKAPDFTLPAADGSTQSLSGFAGKIVVLEWHNKGCPFVRKHYDSGNMQALQKKYAEQGVVWLTMNSSAPGQQGHEDATAALETVKAEGAAPAHVLLDEKGEAGKLYGAKTTPHMFVIDKDGTLAYAGAIDDKKSADIEDVKTAKNYVAAALDSLIAGKPVAEPSTTSYGCGVKYAD